MTSGEKYHNIQLLTGAVAVISFLVVCQTVFSFYLLDHMNRLETRLETGKADNRVGISKPIEVRQTVAENNENHRSKRQASSCGGEYILDGSNSIQIKSPKYPAIYDNNLDCEWIIRPTLPPPTGYRPSNTYGRNIFTLTFNGLIDLENHSNCKFDVIEVRAENKEGPLLGRYCGNNSDTSDISETGPLYIRFKTDGSGGRTGFSATVASTFERHRGGAGDTYPEGDAHTTYVRWGKSTCQSTGELFYDGYAVGFGTSIKCLPFPMELKGNDTKVNSRSNIRVASFYLEGENAIFNGDTDERLVSCVRCHVAKSTTFTVIGWKSCHTDRWTTAYNGYLMTLSSNEKDGVSSSELICVDKSPYQFNDKKPSSKGPVLKLVTSGYGFWYDERPVPCAVCVSND